MKKQKILFDNIPTEDFIKIFNSAESKAWILKNYNLPINGTSHKYLNKKIEDLCLDTKIIEQNFFDKHNIKKTCPECGNDFFVKIKNKKDNKKICCSCRCSNLFFEKGKKEILSEKSYRSICFRFHEKKCCICNEKNIVEVHHYDGNHKNNSVENLIPLCPTHHKYYHSRFKNIIIKKINEYKDNFCITHNKGNNV